MNFSSVYIFFIFKDLIFFFFFLPFELLLFFCFMSFLSGVCVSDFNVN